MSCTHPVDDFMPCGVCQTAASEAVPKPADAIEIVATARAYIIEHYGFSAESFTGYTPTNDFDRAVDVLVRFAQDVRAIAYRGDCDVCGVPDELMDLLYPTQQIDGGSDG